MSITPSFSVPVLSPMGSVDMFTTYGNCVYQIILDSTMVTLGNILMFEYKITNADTTTVTPENTMFGYVNLDYATAQNGIQNQWSLTIPSENNIYNPSLARKISVRAYTGLLEQTEIGVSPWSNALDVHNPPEQPTIFKCYYDSPSTNLDDLYVLLDNNSSYNYNEIQFIIAYYYTNAVGETVWAVTDHLVATDVTYYETVYKLLTVPEFGSVSSEIQVVYTAVYAVYPYSYALKEYYAVSHISDTLPAGPVSEYLSPTITSIDYAVYTTPYVPSPEGDQMQQINFVGPVVQVLPTFTVSNFILECKLNDAETWVVLSNNIGATATSYEYNPYSELGADCGDVINYRLRCESTTGTLSPWSDVATINVFKYSTPVQNLAMDYTSYNNETGQIVLRVAFEAPANMGCGVDERGFVVSVTGAGETASVDQTVDYNSSIGVYTSEFTLNQPFNQVGSISVVYRAKDTNSELLRSSEAVSIPYVAATVGLSPIVYNIYAAPHNLQSVALAWSNPLTGLPSGWSVDSYDVMLESTGTYVSGETAVYNTQDLSYTYSIIAPYNECGTTLTFRILANVSTESSSAVLASNVEIINYFEYSEAPTNLLVNWASIVIGETGSNSAIDVCVTFNNPTSTGCGAPINSNVGSWVVQIYSGSSPNGSLLSTKYVDYTVGGNYLVLFDNLTYASAGYANVYLRTENTNYIADSSVTPQNDAIIDGLNSSADFISSGLPIFRDMSINVPRTALSFKVYTQTLLKPYAKIIYFDSDNFVQRALPFLTTGHSVVLLDNNVYEYVFTLTPDLFGLPSLPVYSTALVSNEVGIEAEAVADNFD